MCVFFFYFFGRFGFGICARVCLAVIKRFFSRLLLPRELGFLFSLNRARGLGSMESGDWRLFYAQTKYARGVAQRREISFI